MKRMISMATVLALAGGLAAYSPRSGAARACSLCALADEPDAQRQAARSQAARPAPIRGFAAKRVAVQRELESKLKALASPQQAEEHLRFLSAEPHMAGTPGSRRVAEYIRDKLAAYGFEAELVRYRVWLPHPVEVKLELTAPQPMILARQEEPVEGDPFSADSRAVVGYNGFSPSGDVTAPVVYVNYGLPEDYAELARLGVSVEGKIALARYGRAFRGVKVNVAEANKAVGVILYSDPADDGYVAGDPYPRGPWRPMSGIQRGSVYYGFFHPGDPLTPGVAATDDAKRIAPADATTLPRIPTLPIAARDAAEILRHLQGPRVPRAWQGGLPMSYHVGPGDSVVRLRLDMDYRLRDIWNVVARLRGASEDEWVVAGNHHDAWVFGAVDPSSGTAVLLELGRALGTLARDGWKPKRTIVLCAWDAEEFGLIGSVEWVEEHRAELQRKAVAYLNIDSAVSGPNFGASGTPSLHELARDAAREVTDPRTGRSVYEEWLARAARSQRPAVREAPVGILGSGSDFTPFYHHAGIPALDISSGGEYGVYHSIYDNFAWMKKFGDPEFSQHAVMTRLAGIVVLRLAEADTLPFDYEAYARTVEQYLADLSRSVRESSGTLDLKLLEDAAAALRASAGRLTRAPHTARDNTRMNRALVDAEQALLSPQGLSGRPWFRHTVFAPGIHAGYAAVTLPGVREAAARGDWETARAEAVVLAAALRRAAARLDAAARMATAP